MLPVIARAYEDGDVPQQRYWFRRPYAQFTLPPVVHGTHVSSTRKALRHCIVSRDGHLQMNSLLLQAAPENNLPQSLVADRVYASVQRSCVAVSVWLPLVEMAVPFRVWRRRDPPRFTPRSSSIRDITSIVSETRGPG